MKLGQRQLYENVEYFSNLFVKVMGYSQEIENLAFSLKLFDLSFVKKKLLNLSNDELLNEIELSRGSFNVIFELSFYFYFFTFFSFLLLLFYILFYYFNFNFLFLFDTRIKWIFYYFFYYFFIILFLLLFMKIDF